MRPHIRLASAIVALMAAILVAAPVAASSPWTVYGQTGTNAYAYGSECTNNTDGTTTCHNRSIDVFEGKLHEAGMPNRTTEQTCYSEYTETFDPNAWDTIEYHALFGCTFDAGTLSADHLATITLAPTTVVLTAIECDAEKNCTETPAGSTVIAGTWTGVGPTYISKAKGKFGDGTCIEVDSDRSSFRDALFEGSIPATEASIHVGSFTSGLIARTERQRS